MLAGFGEAAITPPDPVGHELAGYITRRGKSRGVHDDISIRVLFLETSNSLAVVSLDLLAVDEKIRDDVRRIARQALGETHTIVTATHTHSAPATLFSDTLLTYGSDTFREDYYAFFLERAAEAFEKAADAREAEVFAHRAAIEGVATDRNDPGKPIDNTARILEFRVRGGSYLLVNYAVHPTVLGPKNTLISSDLAGSAVRSITVRGGFSGVVFTNGAAGNVSTRFTRRGQTFSEAERLGNLLASQVIEALKKPGKPVNVDHFDVQVLTVAVNYTPLSAKAAEIRESLRGLLLRSKGRRVRTLVEAVATLYFLGRVQGRVGVAPSGARVEINRVRAGNVGILALPFEVHSDIALALSSRAEPARVDSLLLFSYANGYYGYLTPTRELSYEALACLLDENSRTSLLETLAELASDI